MLDNKCINKECQLCYPPAKGSNTNMSAKDTLTQWASDYEENANTAYAYEKWHEAATLYRLANDLREKAQGCVEESEEEASVNVIGTQGENYKVTRDECTCLDFRFRGGPCKHMQNFKAGAYAPGGRLRYQTE
jgi:hypothetical protein